MHAHERKKAVWEDDAADAADEGMKGRSQKNRCFISVSQENHDERHMHAFKNNQNTKWNEENEAPNMA